MMRDLKKKNKKSTRSTIKNCPILCFKVDMEVCYWALLFMPLVILHHLLNVFVQLANKRGFKQKKMLTGARGSIVG
jgi:hypothetical protein